MDLFGFLRRFHSPTATPVPRSEAPADVLQPQEKTEVARENPDAAPQPGVLPSPSTPREIRRLLFDAVTTGDEARLHALCKEHEALIVQNQAAWLEVPPEFRTSPELYEWYGNGLRAIRQFCAERTVQYELTDGITRILDGSQDHDG